MTTPGYPDYARLTRGGNLQLCGVTGNISDGQLLFRGYVGDWPYTAVFINVNTTADALRFEMAYYSDNTFTTLIGFRYAIRQGAQFSSITYGNMSDWMTLIVHTKSTNPIPVVGISAYASNGYTPQSNMDSMDVPLFLVSQSVAATTTLEFRIQHVHPTSARWFISSAATSWSYTLRYYDYSSNAITTLFPSGTFGSAGAAEEVFPMLDAPMYLDIRNNGAAAAVITASLLADGP